MYRFSNHLIGPLPSTIPKMAKSEVSAIVKDGSLETHKILKPIWFAPTHTILQSSGTRKSGRFFQNINGKCIFCC